MLQSQYIVYTTINKRSRPYRFEVLHRQVQKQFDSRISLVVKPSTSTPYMR